MEDKPYRIKIKIGANEFDAEGDPKIVDAQFALFMAAATAAISQPPPPASAAPLVTNPAGSAADAAPPLPPPQNLAAELGRVFRQGDPMSLAALPKSGDAPKADALLLLIYGYTVMGNEQAVTGTTLMKAARQSGIALDRIDRTIDARKEFVLMAGAKKGLRYSLNNRGLNEVERLMKQLVE